MLFFLQNYNYSPKKAIFPPVVFIICANSCKNTFASKLLFKIELPISVVPPLFLNGSLHCFELCYNSFDRESYKRLVDILRHKRKRLNTATLPNILPLTYQKIYLAVQYKGRDLIASHCNLLGVLQ